MRRLMVSAVGAMVMVAMSACGGTRASVQEPAAPASAKAAAPQPAASAPDATADEAAAAQASLRVSHDIVRSCPMMRAVRPPPGEEEDTWLYLLKNLADCMNDGHLRHQHVVLQGGTQPQMVVAFVLTKMGVDDSRIERTDSGDDSGKKLECRIDVAPREGVTASNTSNQGRLAKTAQADGLAVSVNTQRVVAMAMGNDLE